jgi:hypothetical protein
LTRLLTPFCSPQLLAATPFLITPQGDSNDPQKTLENTRYSGQGGTDSGTPADAGTVEALAAAVKALSPADRASLAALLLPDKPEGR